MELKLEIIRGKRINDQLEKLVMERSDVNNLTQNTNNFLPVSTKRQNATDPISITQMEILPYVGTKTLNIDAIAHSPNTKPAQYRKPGDKAFTDYNTKVIFNQVTYEPESTDTNISFVAKDGNEYHMQPIELNTNTVRVNCNCLDFYWRFKSYNAKDQSLAGRAPPPYKPVSNRGPSNIKRVPGLCKHLLQTIEALKQSGMVT